MEKRQVNPTNKKFQLTGVKDPPTVHKNIHVARCKGPDNKSKFRVKYGYHSQFMGVKGPCPKRVNVSIKHRSNSLLIKV